MARINLETISRVEKNKNSVHEEVNATYTVFEKDGAKYVQIDTYGKNDRAIPDKISQSFQFDEQTARFVIELLAKEFDMTFKIS